MLVYKWTSGVWLFVARGVANLSRVLDRGGHYKRHSSLFATVDTMDSPHLAWSHKCACDPKMRESSWSHKPILSQGRKIGIE